MTFSIRKKISGTSDKRKSVNDILPQDLADERLSFFRHNYGVISGFEGKIIDGIQLKNTVRIEPGAMHAYGYVGAANKNSDFTFYRPKKDAFIFVYAEIDLSVIPNKFAIKTRDNGAHDETSG